MNPKTLFDITAKPFDWMSLVPPTGLLLVGIFLTQMERKNIGKFLIRRIGHILCFVAAIIAAYTSAKWFTTKRAGALALEKGKCSVIQGEVTSFRPMTYAGQPHESFSIGNQSFSYSDFVVTPCFNNSSSHGGPMRPGLHLRVSYSDDCILRIEILVEGNPTS
jgi:hypothetical protein